MRAATCVEGFLLSVSRFAIRGWLYGSGPVEPSCLQVCPRDKVEVTSYLRVGAALLACAFPPFSFEATMAKQDEDPTLVHTTSLGGAWTQACKPGGDVNTSASGRGSCGVHH